MAVFKQVVQVNSGNTGWDRSHVITALEQVFANLGWHGGVAKTGCIRSITPPWYSGTSPGWVNQLPAITSSAVNNKTWTVTNGVLNKYVFTQTAGTGDMTGENVNIVCEQGDLLTFNLSASGTPFYIVWDNTSGYVPGTEIDGDYSDFPTSRVTEGKMLLSSASILNVPSAQGVETGTVTWNTANVINGTYYYVCGNNAAMKGSITILPRPSQAGSVYLPDLAGYTYNRWYQLNQHRCFYDCTIAASGSRSAATFRVYRSSNGRISGIEVLNAETTSGWSDNEVFTIPGNQIGGSSPANDIVFGAISATSPTISVTDLGAGTSFYQKNLSQSFAILKNINDPAKRFGTTYYSFHILADRPNLLYFNSGPDWIFSNTKSTWSYSTGNGPGGYYSSDGNHKWDNPGYFAGVDGVDTNTAYPSVGFYNVQSGALSVNFCRSTAPQSYPLAIRVYRAQAPQDQNFAIIQFTQTVNSIVETYGTFFLHRGTGYGSGIWDLSNVYQGGISRIETYGNSGFELVSILTNGQMGSYQGSYSSPVNTENPSTTSRTSREALYGYERDTSRYLSQPISSRYASNIYSDLDENTYSYENKDTSSVVYYRSSIFDSNSLANRPGLYNYNPSTDYYKVIKGIPLCTSFIPQPYYLPDDFVIIQFLIQPGEVLLTTGDTITISPSEQYEIINVGRTNNVNVLGVGLSTRGIAFCSRIQ